MTCGPPAARRCASTAASRIGSRRGADGGWGGAGGGAGRAPRPCAAARRAYWLEGAVSRARFLRWLWRWGRQVRDRRRGVRAAPQARSRAERVFLYRSVALFAFRGGERAAARGGCSRSIARSRWGATGGCRYPGSAGRARLAPVFGSCRGRWGVGWRACARIERDGRRRCLLGMLDAIELFAGTVSICARLNQIALPSVTALEEGLPDQVALAWLTLVGDAWPGMRCRLCARSARRRAPRRARRREPTGPRTTCGPGSPATGSRTCSCSSCCARSGARRATWAAPAIARLAPPVALCLLFVSRSPPLATRSLAARGRLRERCRHERAEVLLPHGTQSFDSRAFAVVSRRAALWPCGARPRRGRGERFDDLARDGEPDAYPSFACASGTSRPPCCGGGRRRRRHRQADHRAGGGRRTRARAGRRGPRARGAGVQRSLGPRPRGERHRGGGLRHRIAARPRRGAARSPEHDALERGVDAMEAGRLDDAEREFRAVAARADAPLAGMAHALLGRVLEERGDLRAAEEQYLRGDALGDGEAANDVGLIPRRAARSPRRRRPTGARRRAATRPPPTTWLPCTTSAARTRRPPRPSRVPMRSATRRPPRSWHVRLRAW